MKKLMLLAILLTFVSASQAQAPTKFFRVKGYGAQGGTVLAGGFSIDFKNAASRNVILDAFRVAYGYQETVPDPKDPTKTIPNPVSKADFFGAQIERYIAEVVKGQLSGQAAETARKAKVAELGLDLPDAIKP